MPHSRIWSLSLVVLAIAEVAQAIVGSWMAELPDVTEKPK